MLQVGNVVKYAGYKWYVIGITEKKVTLLSKKNFGGHKFDEKSNDYKNSEIRAYLNSTILRSIEDAGGNPLPVKLSDVICTDKVWLLSVKEAEKLPLKIRKIVCFWWWLRSPSKYYRLTAASVNLGGSVNTDQCR